MTNEHLPLEQHEEHIHKSPFLCSTKREGAVTDNIGNTVESRKRPLSNSSDTSLAPRKQQKKGASTISENSAKREHLILKRYANSLGTTPKKLYDQAYAKAYRDELSKTENIVKARDSGRRAALSLRNEILKNSLFW